MFTQAQQAQAEARYQRIVRLNAAENEEARSDAAFAAIEKARLRREAAERAARIAAYLAQPRPAVRPLTRADDNGPCIVVRRLPGGVERRCVDWYTGGDV